MLDLSQVLDESWSNPSRKWANNFRLILSNQNIALRITTCPHRDTKACLATSLPISGYPQGYPPPPSPPPPRLPADWRTENGTDTRKELLRENPLDFKGNIFLGEFSSVILSFSSFLWKTANFELPITQFTRCTVERSHEVTDKRCQ